jgi:hypothetical protein
MPYKSDILSKIYSEYQPLLDDIYNNFETKCIESDFNLLTKKNYSTKINLQNLILDNIDYKKVIKNL